MSGPELGLAVLGGVDVCIRFGKALMEKLAAYKAAETEIAEKIVNLELLWKKTSVQLEFIDSIWNELDADHQRLQEQVLQFLIDKMRLAIVMIERVSKSRSSGEGDTTPVKPMVVNKVKYALLKDTIDSAIKDLASWQLNFDPTWFLILRISRPAVDQELAEYKNLTSKPAVISTAARVRAAIKDDTRQGVKIFLDDSKLNAALITEIQMSAAVKKFQLPGSSTWYILDVITCQDGDNVKQMKGDIRELARKLTSADPTMFGLLKCQGVVIEKSQKTGTIKSFDFLFPVPQGLHDPHSLRSRLLQQSHDHSLSKRLNIAKQLARSVSYIHTYGFVHKDIRPETILLFQDSQSTLAAAFLLGFQKFRLAAGDSMRMSDGVWYTNLYRHPERQGIKPEQFYVMQHDIYSLGVCLLEIGIWESFVEFAKNSTSTPSTKIQTEEKLTKPVLMKDKLVSVAKTYLPPKMGDIYTEVVINCLTCLDPDNRDFGDETDFEDEDGILVGVKYIEKIILNLDKISI